jgi:hypothetical protein
MNPQRLHTLTFIDIHIAMFVIKKVTPQMLRSQVFFCCMQAAFVAHARNVCWASQGNRHTTLAVSALRSRCHERCHLLSALCRDPRVFRAVRAVRKVLSAEQHSTGPRVVVFSVRHGCTQRETLGLMLCFCSLKRIRSPTFVPSLQVRSRACFCFLSFVRPLCKLLPAMLPAILDALVPILEINVPTGEVGVFLGVFYHSVLIAHWLVYEWQFITLDDQLFLYEAIGLLVASATPEVFCIRVRKCSTF